MSNLMNNWYNATTTSITNSSLLIQIITVFYTSLLRVEADFAPFFTYVITSTKEVMFLFLFFFWASILSKEKKNELIKYDGLLHLHGFTHCACQGGVWFIFTICKALIAQEKKSLNGAQWKAAGKAITTSSFSSPHTENLYLSTIFVSQPKDVFLINIILTILEWPE